MRLYAHLQCKVCCFFFKTGTYMFKMFSSHIWIFFLFFLHLYNKECKGQSFKIKVINQPLSRPKGQSWFKAILFSIFQYLFIQATFIQCFLSLVSKYIFKGSCTRIYMYIDKTVKGQRTVVELERKVTFACLSSSEMACSKINHAMKWPLCDVTRGADNVSHQVGYLRLRWASREKAKWGRTPPRAQLKKIKKAAGKLWDKNKEKKDVEGKRGRKDGRSGGRWEQEEEEKEEGGTVRGKGGEEGWKERVKGHSHFLSISTRGLACVCVCVCEAKQARLHNMIKSVLRSMW